MKDEGSTPLLAGVAGRMPAPSFGAFTTSKKSCITVAVVFSLATVIGVSRMQTFKVQPAIIQYARFDVHANFQNDRSNAVPHYEIKVNQDTILHSNEDVIQSIDNPRPFHVPYVPGRVFGPGSRGVSKFGCKPVLERSTAGVWVPRPYTSKELELVERFLNKTRSHHKLPLTLERRDKRCGNTNMAEPGSAGGLSWYKALCNPRGPKPCCYSNHTCITLSREECRCDGCHDMRQPVHAELSNWKPNDSTCQLREYNGEAEICPLLNNLTIHIIGDSYMRQIYISLLGALRSGYQDGVIKDTKLTKARIEECDDYYRYFSKCSPVIPEVAHECNNTVHILRTSRWRVSQIKSILEFFKKYVGKENTFIVFGLGIHDMYKPDVIISKILQPVLSLLGSKPWPRLIWAAPHAPGLLKTPLVKAQSRESVGLYNAKVTPFMRSKGIPVLDGFGLTNNRDGVMSYDGTHYGKGLNDVKAQILLNHIHEIKSNL